MRSGWRVCKKWWGGFWTQTIDNPNSHQNIIITFWPIYNVLWNLHANLFRGICIKSTNEQAKSMWKQLISVAQVIKFCKISSSRGGFNPKPTPLSCEDRKLLRTTQFRTPYHAVPRISTIEEAACLRTRPKDAPSSLRATRDVMLGASYVAATALLHIVLTLASCPIPCQHIVLLLIAWNSFARVSNFLVFWPLMLFWPMIYS